MRVIPVFLLAGSIALAQRQVAPIPADPHELVTGDVQVPSSPGERATIFSLLERGKQNSDMHMPGSAPFSIKMSFTATGAAAHTGTGEIIETWLSGRSWRYDQSMGDYSEVRIGVRGQIYGKGGNEVPLRVQMLRNAMFWPVGGNPSNSNLRSAAAQWNGKPVTCVLLMGNSDQPNSPGRRWEETEYCVDNASGLLQIYSHAPGTYAVYGYGQNVQFHGRQVPDQITMYAGGAAVLEAHLLSIADAGNVDPSLLTPTSDMGPAPATANMRFPMTARNPSGSKTVQPVIVHAIIGLGGTVLEQEVSMASDAGLAESAMELVKNSNFMKSASLRAVYINVKFQ